MPPAVSQLPSALQLGSRFRSVRLGIGNIPFDSLNTRSIEIPKGLLNKGMTIRLSGSLTVAVANAAAVFSEAPLGLIRKLEIVADGNRTLWTADGRELYNLASFMRRVPGELTPPSNLIGTNAFAVTIQLDQEAIQMVHPPDSYFDPRLFERTELRITWGAATDIATAGGGGTIAIAAGCIADIQAQQTTEGVDRIMFDKIVTFDERDVAATNPSFVVPVPRTGLLAQCLVRTTRDAGAGAGPVPVNNIINSVAVRSENTVKHSENLLAGTLREWNRIDYQQPASKAGYLFLDFTEDGQISTALNTYGLNALDLMFDVTRTSGTEKLRVLYQFFQPRQAVS